MPRHADDDEYVLVHAGLDVFQPHRRQPDLSSAERGGNNQAPHLRRYARRLVERNGQIKEHEARTHPRRNVLQKALGGANQFVDPQVGAVGCERGDIFLLCSDGLTEGLYDHSTVDLLRATAKEPEACAAKALVEAAVHNDGRDNTTALVVQVV